MENIDSNISSEEELVGIDEVQKFDKMNNDLSDVQMGEF